MVEKRGEFGHLHEQLQGRCYDADYAVRYIIQNPTSTRNISFYAHE